MQFAQHTRIKSSVDKDEVEHKAPPTTATLKTAANLKTTAKACKHLPSEN